jgi:predicted TIM-barrel fold metal-dependent hydrolase
MDLCPPADPNPKKPRLALPPGACDAVCHVIGPRARFPFSHDRKYDAPDAPFEALRRLHTTLGFERAALVQATVHGADNSAMVDALQRSEGRYRGVAILDGSESDSELARLHSAGVRGVRFNFVGMLGGPPPADVFERIVARIADLGWHVALHVGGDELLEHESRMRKLRVPVVIEHMGRVDIGRGLEQPSFKSMLRLMKDHGFWVKIDMGDRLSLAGPPYTDVAPFAQAIVAAAPDQVLWGTDWPHPMYGPGKPMPNDGDLVDLLAAYVPDAALRERILVHNAVTLYRYL